MNKARLEDAAIAYRRQHYVGPTPHWPRPTRWSRPLLTAAGVAAALTLVAIPWLGQEPEFGRHYDPSPSAYAALKKAREAAPMSRAGQRATLSSTAMPPRPKRQNGFSNSAPKADAEANLPPPHSPTFV